MAVEPLFGDIFNQQPEDVDPKGKAGFTDYVTDVPVGILRGASQAVQGLLSLGAMPVDYLADTNLLSAIDLSLIHISEPTRLRRISYSGFWMKK